MRPWFRGWPGPGGAAVTVAAMAKIGLYPIGLGFTPELGMRARLQSKLSTQISLDFLQLETHGGQVGALSVQYGQ
jgi:hypothetical protein